MTERRKRKIAILKLSRETIQELIEEEAEGAQGGGGTSNCPGIICNTVKPCPTAQSCPPQAGCFGSVVCQTAHCRAQP